MDLLCFIPLNLNKKRLIDFHFSQLHPDPLFSLHHLIQNSEIVELRIRRLCSVDVILFLLILVFLRRVILLKFLRRLFRLRVGRGLVPRGA